MRLPTLIWLLALTTVPAGAAEFGPYQATVLRVIDGDTLELRVAVWPDHTVQAVVRLAGVNAPELKARAECERAAASRAVEFVRVWTAQPGRLTFTRTGREKYGRQLGRVARDGEDLAAALLAAGHARPYDGGRRGAWC